MGVTNIFSLETPLKRPKNSNFLNIHLIKNENTYLDEKMSDQDAGDKIFEFRPILLLFWSQKYDLKYSIWVLKRCVLAREIQWHEKNNLNVNRVL